MSAVLVPFKSNFTIGGVEIFINPAQKDNFAGELTLYAPLEGEMLPFHKVGHRMSKNVVNVLSEAVEEAQYTSLRGMLEVRIPRKGQPANVLAAPPESWFAKFQVLPLVELEPEGDPDAKDEYTDRRGSSTRPRRK